MKMIEAIIMPKKLAEVESALQEIGIDDYMESMTICRGRQSQGGQAMRYRGQEYVATGVEKVKLEVITADDSVEKVIELIGAIAKTERTGDCRIFVFPFLEAS